MRLLPLLRVSIIFTVAMALNACSPREPLRIGFIGGISGRVNDLGISGLNGVRLAVFERNHRNGIGGRRIELIEEDDRQSPQGALAAFQRLLDKKVVAIIGPMTSAMAMTLVPLANASNTVLISPTVSTNLLSGQDDHFFRVLPSTREFAQRSADYYYRRGFRRIQVIHDLNNRSYTESWFVDFSAAFRQHGGVILQPLSFTSGEGVDYAKLARESLQRRVDAIVVIGTAVETAMLCQAIRDINKKITIGTTEWAATDRLISLGGAAVEQIVIAQIIDHDNRQPSYLAFRDAFSKRYGGLPGFSGLNGFDAANVLFAALAEQQPGEALRATLVRLERYAGAQHEIRLDRYGDAHGTTWLYTVRDGKYVRLESPP